MLFPPPWLLGTVQRFRGSGADTRDSLSGHMRQTSLVPEPGCVCARCVQDVALSAQHLRNAVSICLTFIRGEAPGPSPGPTLAAKAAGGPTAHSAAKQVAPSAGAPATARLPAAVACGFRQVTVESVWPHFLLLRRSKDGLQGLESRVLLDVQHTACGITGKRLRACPSMPSQALARPAIRDTLPSSCRHQLC